MADAKPFSKQTQLARAERRHHRQVAGKKRWQQIAEAKQGPCRVTGKQPPNELAHIIPRSWGGPDSEWNIIPLAHHAHALFDQYHEATLKRVAETLTDQEYAGLINWGGEGILERRFKIKFERAV